MTDYRYPPTKRAAQLDKDIAELRQWFTDYHGRDFDYETDTPDVRNLGVERDTNYPLPDSYRPEIVRRPKLTREKAPPFDRAAYDERVAKLTAAGYIPLNRASILYRRSLWLLRADAATGLLKADDAIGMKRRGLSVPRYFVTEAEMVRYLAWQAAGRKKPAKTA